MSHLTKRQVAEIHGKALSLFHAKHTKDAVHELEWALSRLSKSEAKFIIRWGGFVGRQELARTGRVLPRNVDAKAQRICAQMRTSFPVWMKLVEDDDLRYLIWLALAEQANEQALPPAKSTR